MLAGGTRYMYTMTWLAPRRSIPRYQTNSENTVTGIAAKKVETPNYGSLPEPNIFYKKAFMTLLPITVLLGIVVLLKLFF